MLIDQGFNFSEKGELIITEKIKTGINENLVPKGPICGREMDFNLRIGNNFMQDKGWCEHKKIYKEFSNKNENEEILYIELGVGYMTPEIIK